MRRRRAQKLEKKVQQFRSKDGGPDTGGTLEVPAMGGGGFSRSNNYTSPSSGEAFRDQQLTINFGLWDEIFLCADMFPNADSKTLSVCLYPEKLPWRRWYQSLSPTLVIDTSMERSLRVLQHGNPKIWIFFQKSSKFEFWLMTKSWNHLSFVNISPTLVIDTSMERSSSPTIGLLAHRSTQTAGHT